MPIRTLAVDIDLGRFTAVHSVWGVLAHGQDPFNPPDVSFDADRILIEIAGPVMHHQESHSHRRWMIYNTAVAAYFESVFNPVEVLVCPSTLWTQGYTELERDAIAGITPLKYKTVKGTPVPIWAEPHDVRECRCMLYFHERKPEIWVPLPDYLRSLCK